MFLFPGINGYEYPKDREQPAANITLAADQLIGSMKCEALNLIILSYV